MKTIIKQQEVKQQNSTQEAIAWLEAEYPKGINLIYIDYRERYEEMSSLQKLLKDCDNDDDFNWKADAQYETIACIYREYTEQNEIDELTEEVEDAMREWLYDHDTSNPTRDLLKNTHDQLFYINTIDYSEEDKSNHKELLKKYGKTEDRKKEINYVINNQFYGAPVSFYFYASPLDVYNAIYDNDNKYIVIKRAYFSTIDRIQGSNWLGEKACFNLILPKDNFIENFFLDSAKSTGYGWGSIAGQCNYDEAEVYSSKTQENGCLKIETEVSEAQKREARLQKDWDDSKHKKCTGGDMNWSRHVGPQEYSNNFPCGTTCKSCGTFWID